MREVIVTSHLTKKTTTFFERWSWFKFSNLGLAHGMVLKLYTSIAKGLNLKVTKFLELIPTSVEITWEKLVGSLFDPPHILSNQQLTFLTNACAVEERRKQMRRSLFLIKLHVAIHASSLKESAPTQVFSSFLENTSKRLLLFTEKYYTNKIVKNLLRKDGNSL